MKALISAFLLLASIASYAKQVNTPCLAMNESYEKKPLVLNDSTQKLRSTKGQ